MKREQWFKPYIRAYYGRFALTILLGVLTVGMAGALMFTSGMLISKSALRPENILMVYVPTVLVRTFGIGRAVSHYVERLVGHDAILRVLSDMRVRLYRVLEPQALFLRSRYRTGDILGTLADDIEYLQNVYMRTVFPSIIALVTYGILIAALGYFDGVFAALMALYMFVLIAILPIVSLMITRVKHRQMKQQRNGLYQRLTDAVLGLGDWVISGRSQAFVDSYEEDEARVAAIERSINTFSRWRMFTAQLVVGLMVVSMIYWAGGQYADGRMPVYLIAAFVLVVIPLMDAFLPISEAIEKIPQYQDSVERLVRMEQEAPASVSIGESKQSIHGATQDRSTDRGAQSHMDALERKEWAQAGSGSAYSITEQGRMTVRLSTKDGVPAVPDASTYPVYLEQVSFSYEGEASKSVDGLTLQVEAGKKIAIIGRSGAGKSTLLKLIQGAITPSQGRVLVQGKDAASYGDDISAVIGVLNQSPHLFDTTVSNNIRLGRLEASDEEIREACEQVKLGALMDSLPQGIDTPMHEAGQRFSGGERQRVALARILLQHTPIVIMDEPTVGLDPITERELLRTVFDVMREKTLIWITHHLASVEQMDEIIFMDEGRIIMRGSHAELMEREPRYRRLYELDRPFTLGA
ncbi:amino acid ABC transporter ATP-binding/permease protein [Paenibacillus sp. 1001270B_150601_E10]|uniref:amino acid ABC transporter ATP-binding/permease protein n=1 Tax=Paenibacillus sp. 1001270B_150601_E10 TaxID=2787079 RepID=UPI00189DA97D|nr:amino acid ABC transporter ATP-binding/permease protein [Paenibacillus sp. 1001270B_150601_E10]